MRILITGCNGFMASRLAQLLSVYNDVIGVDINKDLYSNMRYEIIKWSLEDFHKEDIRYMTHLYECDLVINMAAETFVDTSIKKPFDFIETNIKGTANILDLCRIYNKRLIHISTDEVYGSTTGYLFNEKDRLKPGNPYSASKAAADMVCLSYQNTFGMNISILRPENNYGLYQKPEKAIPVWITSHLNNRPVPLYGEGNHIRRWLHVDDFCDAVKLVIEKGASGIYNIGGNEYYTNRDVVDLINKNVPDNKSEIKYIPDEEIRPGHDYQYAISTEKIESLGFKPKRKLEDSLKGIISWYSKNPEWQNKQIRQN